jgi:hypothetical protein
MRSARVGRAGVGRPAGRFPSRALQWLFLFLFEQIFALYLILHIKLCVDSKIIEISV